MKWDREELARFIGTTGIAMLVAGYLRYSIQGELLTFSKVVLAIGALCLLASIVIGFGGILRFFSKRSSQLGTNTTILSVVVIAILVIVNFVGFRHHKRFDLTTEKLYTLSDQTKQVVGGLQKDVTIVRFDKSPNAALDDQMAEYTSLSRHLKFQNIDPQQKPEVAQQYGATRMGDVILASGPRKEHLETGATSEEDITGAIIKVTQDKVKTVCFVTGHGEKSLTDDGEDGYSHLDAGLKKENYVTRTLNLVSENGVASDCSVVVIAGPTQQFFPQEAEMLDKYLAGTGKGLILVDPQTDPKLGEIFQAMEHECGRQRGDRRKRNGPPAWCWPRYPAGNDFRPKPNHQEFYERDGFFPVGAHRIDRGQIQDGSSDC